MSLFDYFPAISFSIVFGTIALFVLSFVSMGVIFGLICRVILRNKGYPPARNHGFLWGFFLGVIGFIVCMMKPPFYNGQNNMYGCGQPFGMQPGSNGWYCSCGGLNPPDSRVCRFCGNAGPY